MSNYSPEVTRLMKKIKAADGDEEFGDAVREVMDHADEETAEHFYSGLAKIYLDQHQQTQTKYIRMVSLMHPEGLLPLVDKSEVCHAAMCGTFARALLTAYRDDPHGQKDAIDLWIDNCVRDFQTRLEATIEMHCEAMGIPNVLDPNAATRAEILQDFADE